MRTPGALKAIPMTEQALKVAVHGVPRGVLCPLPPDPEQVMKDKDNSSTEKQMTRKEFMRHRIRDIPPKVYHSVLPLLRKLYPVENVKRFGH